MGNPIPDCFPLCLRYSITNYFLFPVDGIPIGPHRSLYTKSRGSPQPRISLSAGVRLSCFNLNSRHTSKFSDSWVICIPNRFSNGMVWEMAVSNTYPKHACQLIGSVAVNDLFFAYSNLFSGAISISYEPTGPHKPFSTVLSDYFPLTTTIAVPFTSVLKTTYITLFWTLLTDIEVVVSLGTNIRLLIDIFLLILSTGDDSTTVPIFKI